MAETAKGGPFPEITESDIFVNCKPLSLVPNQLFHVLFSYFSHIGIYLSSKIPPFVTIDSLKTPGRNLSVVCDVSADTTNPYDPQPVVAIDSLRC